MLFAFQCGRTVPSMALTELNNKNIMKKGARGWKGNTVVLKHVLVKLAFHLSKSKVTF
jgi:hypothetical protein